MNVKHAISAIREDQVILRSIALGLIGMAIATAVMWQQLVVEPRLQAAEKHYGINISAVADRVDLYMAAYLKQLGTVANQPGVIQSFAEGNQTALSAGITTCRKPLQPQPFRRHQGHLLYRP